MSVYRTPNLSDGRSLVLDAEQWAVLNIPRRNGSGNVIGYTTCAMPSPDALTAAAARGGFQLDNPGNAGGRIDVGAMEAAASIGLRTQTIQTLRDGMYRMCEAYAAGGMDEFEYGIMMRRYQSHMVAILAVEQLTGAITPSQQRIAAQTPEPVPAPAQAPAPNAGAGQAPPPTGEAPAETGKADEQSGPKADDGEGREAAAEEEAEDAPAAEESPANNRTTPLSARDPAAVISIAQTVEAITLAAMSTDYSSQICLDALRYATDAGMRSKGGHRFYSYCTDLLRQEMRTREAGNEVLLTLARQIVNGEEYSSTDINNIRRLIAQADPTWSSADMRYLFPPHPPAAGQRVEDDSD